MLQDKKYSLALGGGGARGLSHIGMIRYLEEKLFMPAALSGTSIGAIIAGCLALGMTSHMMEKILQNMKWLSLIDIDMKKGLLKGSKIEKFLEEIYEGKTFADTIIPLSITATDIHTGKCIIINTGKISKAVRASIGIPGVFPPYHHDDYQEQELVDGGLSMNLPVEILPPGRVIALSCLRDLSRPIRYKRRVFSLDWQKTIFTNAYSILQKTIDIMLAQNESRSCTSREDILYIRPEFDGLDYYEFHKYREFIESGYRKAEEVLG